MDANVTVESLVTLLEACSLEKTRNWRGRRTGAAVCLVARALLVMRACISRCQRSTPHRGAPVVLKASIAAHSADYFGNQ